MIATAIVFVTTSTLVTMVIGLVIPLLVAVVTRAGLPQKFKVLVLLLFTTISGVVSSVASSLPTTLGGWGHLGINILMTYLAAAAAMVATWEPLHTVAGIHRVTDPHFGLGPAPDPPPPPPPPAPAKAATAAKKAK